MGHILHDPEIDKNGAVVVLSKPGGKMVPESPTLTNSWQGGILRCYATRGDEGTDNLARVSVD